jgi:hypothetical protein
VPDLGVVIGLAVICNLVAGHSAAFWCRSCSTASVADPAISSGVFVTTVTDVVGFFSFLGIATLWFGSNDACRLRPGHCRVASGSSALWLLWANGLASIGRLISQ